MGKLSREAFLWAGIFILMSLSVIGVLLLQLETDKVTGMFPDTVPIQSEVAFLKSTTDAEKFKRVCRSYAEQLDRFREYRVWEKHSSGL